MKKIVSAAIVCAFISATSVASASTLFDPKRDRAVEDALNDVESAPAGSVKAGCVQKKDVMTIKPRKKFLAYEMGYEAYSYRYKETVGGRHFMNLTGRFQGIFGNLEYRPMEKDDFWGDSSNSYRLETRYGWAHLDYNGGIQHGDGSITPLTTQDTPDAALEMRGLVRKDYPMGIFQFTPYLGLGYRWLKDDSRKQGNAGYLRKSNYTYLPLGMEVAMPLPMHWAVRLNMEYDYLLYGVQRSMISDSGTVDGISYNYNGLKNYQSKGYGLRGSIRLEKAWGMWGVFVEPYFRFWDIEDSDPARVDVNGGQLVGFGLEPSNQTREFGLKAGVLF
ncbi:MAG: hypothetical protein HQL18_00700 [Candidatus Omnitrophica bacterium]|nr:hypothetical protein [Candidatus Omnitrophota bacterium]